MSLDENYDTNQWIKREKNEESVQRATNEPTHRERTMDRHTVNIHQNEYKIKQKLERK